MVGRSWVMIIRMRVPVTRSESARWLITSRGDHSAGPGDLLSCRGVALATNRGTASSVSRSTASGSSPPSAASSSWRYCSNSDTGSAAIASPLAMYGCPSMPARTTTLEIEGREVIITNPDKVFFPRTGHTKLDLVNYYLSVADGAVRGVDGRPMAMKRFVNGAESTPFFQKRAPDSRPEWIETVDLSYPSGRTASEIVVRDAAQLVWVINLGCIDLNPHPVRAEDINRPDELRVDLDPIRGVPWSDVRAVALVTRAVLEDFGLVGWPKTSGSRGFHIYARIPPRWTFPEVRRAAVALAREVERRAPEIATSKWWKEERHGVFVDYNQNSKDHTTASADSSRT